MSAMLAAVVTLLLPSAADQQAPPAGGTIYVRAFDQLWSEMDRQYSYFQLKKIDWPALKSKYRPQAEAAKSTKELVGVLQKMLTELKDQHIWIDGPDGRVGTHREPWEKNWSPLGIRNQLASIEMVGKFVGVGKLKDGFGLLIIENQQAGTPELARQAAVKIEGLRDVLGFVVDLRNAEGGNEAHAMPLASAFCAKPTVYARQKFRAGPGHGDFGPVFDRTPLTPAKIPFTKPVVVILGPRTMSSGEGLAMMFAALPNVTTVGSPTRGSSGGPKPVELKDVGVTVTFSRWVAMLPDGTPIEGRGVIPQIEAKFPITAFGATDPVLEKAIEVLKAKVK
ncbi:MAG: hypothetical protein K1X57_10815 [Gemmataceae bacterium]|nr:hypothetical protein [Gemmataceae bacterium]